MSLVSFIFLINDSLKTDFHLKKKSGTAIGNSIKLYKQVFKTMFFKCTLNFLKSEFKWIYYLMKN